MPKTKQQKAEIIEKLAEKLNQAKVVVLSSFSQKGKKGLDFNTMKTLKGNLKKVDSEYVISKKTLLNLALKKASFGESINPEELEGSIGILFGYKDIIEPVKVLYKLSRQNNALSLYLGLIVEDPERVALRPYGASKKVISKDNLVELANLPPREVLLGQLAWTIRYPLWGLANVLEGNIRGLANALTALTQVKS